MGMYNDIRKGVSENIEIGGFPFYAENIRGPEPFNRREYTFKPVLNGTLSPRRGKYIQRKFSFSTTVYHKRVYDHDKVLAKLCSGPVEVISPAMGGRFKAIVTFDKNIPESSPHHTEYDVEIVEIPGKKSRIPGEAHLTVPQVKKIKSENSDELNVSLEKCDVPYKNNQRNQCVELLQEKLISLGYLDKNSKTGVYDTVTVDAVKSFQKSTDGKLLVDGVFGKYTRDYLLKA